MCGNRGLCANTQSGEFAKALSRWKSSQQPSELVLHYAVTLADGRFQLLAVEDLGTVSVLAHRWGIRGMVESFSVSRNRRA